MCKYHLFVYGLIWFNMQQDIGLCETENAASDSNPKLARADALARMLLVARSFPLALVPAGCENGTWHKFHDKYYRPMPKASRFTRAELRCNICGGHLVSVHGEEEEAFVAKILKKDETSWIGLAQSREGGPYSWSDGSESVYSNLHVLSDSRRQCVSFIPLSTPVWVPGFCDVRRPFVCKLHYGHDSSPKAHVSNIEYEVRLERSALPYTSAARTEVYGGKKYIVLYGLYNNSGRLFLPRPDSDLAGLPDEDIAASTITYHLKSSYVGRIVRLRRGVQSNKRTTHYWPVQSIEVRDPYSRQIYMFDPRKQQLESRHPYYFRDTDATLHCSSKWLEADQKAYLVVPARSTFQSASKACNSCFAHLVEIHSASEHRTLRHIWHYLGMKQNTWINLRKESIAFSNFKWQSGDELDYTAWFGQPIGNDRCATASPGHAMQWFPTPCYEKQAFVCVKDSTDVQNKDRMDNRQKTPLPHQSGGGPGVRLGDKCDFRAQHDICGESITDSFCNQRYKCACKPGFRRVEATRCVKITPSKVVRFFHKKPPFTRIASLITFYALAIDLSELQLSLNPGLGLNRNSTDFGAVRSLDAKDIAQLTERYSPHYFSPESKSRALEYAYRRVGRFVATLTVKHIRSGDEEAIKLPVCIQARPCDSPAVEIDGGGVSWSSRRWFRKHLPVVVTVRVQTLACNPPGQFSFHWRVYTADNSKSLPHQHSELLLFEHIEIDSATLVLPEQTLSAGIYILEVTVTEPEDGDGVAVSRAHLAWIEVTTRGLLAQLSGGAMVAVGKESTVLVDGTASKDRDLPPHQADDKIKVRWTCDVEETKPIGSVDKVLDIASLGSVCFNDDTSIQYIYPYILRFPATALSTQVVSTKPVHFYFRVYIVKGNRMTSAVQEVHVGRFHRKKLQIDCMASSNNCDATNYVPSKKLVLVANANFGSGIRSDWSIEGRKDGVLASIQTATELEPSKDGHMLTVKRNSLKRESQSVEYCYEFKVKMSSVTMAARYCFTLRQQSLTMPSCRISPSFGIAFETVFSCQCGKGTVDPSLKYSLVLHDEDKETFILLYRGFIPVVKGLYFRSGKAKREYRLKLEMHILGLDDSSKAVQLSIQIRPRSNVSLGLLENTMTDASSHLSIACDSGDELRCAYYTGNIALELNELSKGHSGEAREVMQRMKLRDRIMAKIGSSRVNRMELLTASTTALSQVTTTPEELSHQSQVAASSLLLAMAKSVESQAHSGVAGIDEVSTATKSMVSVVSNIFDTVNPTTHHESRKDEGSNTGKKAIILSVLKSVTELRSALSAQQMVGENASTVQHGGFSLSVQCVRLSGGMQFGDIEDESSTPVVSFRLPEVMNVDDITPVDAVMVQIAQYSRSPYIWDAMSAAMTTPVSEITMATRHSELSIQNLNKPLDIFIPQPPGTTDSMVEANLTRENFISLSFTISESTTSLLLFFGIHSDFELPSDAYIKLLLWHKTSTGSSRFRDFISDNCSSCTRVLISDITSHNSTWNVKIGPSKLFGAGLYKLLVKLENTEFVNITALAVEADCMYWDNTTWSNKGCKFGDTSNMTHVHCRCTHMTSFASKFMVLPNKLNFKEDLAMFLTFWRNPVGIITVCVIMTLYSFGMLWCRRKDKKDHVKGSLIDLTPNAEGSYHYVVCVYTKDKKKAGTTATGFLALRGYEASTSPYPLTCQEYKVLQRGDINLFMLREPTHLGKLNSIKVLHNNAGDDPDWYLHKVVIYDATEDFHYTFVCDSWLSSQREGASIERLIPVSNKLNSFQNLFFRHTSSGMQDEHLWYSVIKRPVASPFTRAQRLSCCLSLFITYMVSNIMFYGVIPRPEELQFHFAWRHVSFSWTDFVIGWWCALLVLPVNLLIVDMFRRSKIRDSSRLVLHPHDKPTTPPAAHKWKAGKRERKNDVASKKGAGDDSTWGLFKQKLRQSVKGEFARPNLLPWWCVYVAWVMVALVTAASSFFTILYTFNYGVEKSLHWVKSLLLSATIDIFLDQPLKVVVFAMIAGVLLRRMEDTHWLEGIDNSTTVTEKKRDKREKTFV